jgi:hypothetical protein
MARWAEIAPRYQPDAERLIHLANELEALAQRLDDAAAVFGDGLINAGSLWAHGVQSAPGADNSDSARETPPWNMDPKVKPAPSNMAELFDYLEPKKNNGNEIQIYQVGSNEFAVLLQGSDFSLGGINSLGKDAIPAGLGMDTPYERKVREMLQDLAKNHPGAQIHFAGYSLGGIVAQHVASDDAFFAESGLQLQKVSWYGAPNLGSVPEDKIHKIFNVPGDIVSGLPLSPTPEAALTTTAFLFQPGPTLATGVYLHMQGYQNDWSPVRQKMSCEGVSFDSVEWKLVNFYNDGSDPPSMETVQTHIVTSLSSGVQKTIETYNAATDLARDIARETGDFVGGVARETGEYIGDVRDAVQQRVPEPMRRIPGLF